MAYLCDFCFSPFDTDFVKDYINSDTLQHNLIGNSCVISSCVGKIVDVDDELLITIMTLNEKGYRTVASCFGDVFAIGSNIYIKFADKHIFQELPKDFTIENIDETIISKDIGGIFENISYPQRQILLWNIAIDLLKWSISLPSLDIDEAEKLRAYLFGKTDIIQKENDSDNPILKKPRF